MFPSDRGNVAKPVRMALGSLIIQTRCGLTDRETVQQITENPYLQYFIGLKEFQLTKPFTPVALVKFRKRFNAKRLAKINELILKAEEAQKTEDQDNENHHNDGPGGIPEETETPNAPEEGVNQGILHKITPFPKVYGNKFASIVLTCLSRQRIVSMLVARIRLTGSKRPPFKR